MGKPLGSMYIELGLEHSQFQHNMNAAKRAVNYFSAEARKLDAQMKASGQSVEALGAKHKSLKQAMTAQQDVLKRLKTSFDQLDPGGPKWEKAAIEIERENAKLAAMEGQLGQVETAMRKVHAENSKWGQRSELLKSFGDRAHKVGDQLNRMGDAMKPVSTFLTAGFTLATKKALDFEGQMQTTKALLADTASSSEELNGMVVQLGDSSKKWAREYGISTRSINEGMQEIIKKGFDVNQTMDAMPAILSASKASGEDFNTVMNASTNILQQFGLKAKDTGRVTDSLTYVANKTAAGFGDMGSAMEYVGPVAKNVGMSLEETAAAVGLLSNNGIAGEKAGTVLRGALTRLLKPSEANAVAMTKLGFSAEEFRSGAIKLPDVIERIKKKTEGMTDAQKSALIAQAFGTEAQTAMNILVDQGANALRNLAKETEQARGYTNNLAKDMMKSGQSGVERFKSSLEVLQITIGQKLLPIFTPIIEGVTDLVTKFSEASPAVQKFWTYLALGVAGAYPLLNILGGVANGVGSVAKGLGILAGKTAATKAAAVGIEAIGTAAAGASTSTGLLTAAVGLLSNPITWGVLAVTAVAAIGYFGQKALEAKQRTAEWGTEVSKAEAEALSGFKSKVDETTKAMEGFSSHSVDGVAKVKEAFQDLASEIETLTNKELAKDIELAKKWGLSDEHIQNLKDRAGQTVENVQRMSEEVVNIYKNAKENNRQLSAEEKEIVLNNQTELINKQLELMKYSAEERKAIQKAMNGDFDELNKEQLAKAREATVQWAKEENEVYKQKQAELNELLADGAISKAEHYEMMKSLDAEHAAAMEAYQDRFVKIQAKLIEGIKTPDGGKSLFHAIKKDMEELGFSFEEFENHMRGMADTAAQTSGLTAKSMADMSDEMSAANLAWNGMVLDTKTGEIKTNAQEEVNKALAAEGGWDSMQFILKEANLTSNARLMIAEALVANGQWEGLSPSEKQLVVRGQEAIAGIAESKEHLAIWNSMPTEVKKLLGENTAFMSSADGAKQALERWNLMTPTQKELTATNLTEGDVKLAQGTIDSLMGKSVGLAAIDEASPTVSMAQLVVDSLKQTQPASLQAVDNTGPASASATASLNAPKQGAPAPIHATDLTGPASASATASLNAPKQGAPAPIHATDLTGPVSASANASVNSPRQNSPVQLHATNQTGPQVGAATSAVNSVTQTRVPGITALDHTAGGVNSARDNVNSVQDRTVTITSIFRSIGKAIGFEKGTNYHRGGLAVVNDQKGSLYKELVTLPNGKSFIPEGRDVLIDLPRGSKVLPANKTRSLMAQLKIPRYADGVGIPENSRLLQDLNRVTPQVQVVGRGGLDGSREVISLLKELIELTKGNAALMPEVLNVVVKLGNLTLDEFSQEIGKRLDKQERLRRLTSSY